MKHKRLIFSLALPLAVGSAILAATLGSETATTQLSVSSLALAAPTPYVIRAQGALVCVYQDDVLVCATGIPVASLPQQDQLLLEEGISAETAADLAALLEDLGA